MSESDEMVPEFYEFLKGKASKKVNSIYTFGKKNISTFQYFDSEYKDRKVKFKIFDKDYNFQKKILVFCTSTNFCKLT